MSQPSIGRCPCIEQSHLYYSQVPILQQEPHSVLIVTCTCIITFCTWLLLPTNNKRLLTTAVHLQTFDSILSHVHVRVYYIQYSIYNYMYNYACFSWCLCCYYYYYYVLFQGVEKCLNHLKTLFPDIDVVSISGNYCTDKKPSAMNWIEGRGKYVVCDAIIPAQIVEKV